MTDTPRTQAELLTDFADNQNHGITAQKMRNYVVSVKQQPWQHFFLFTAFKDSVTSMITLPNAGTSYGDVTVLPLQASELPSGAAASISGNSLIDDTYTLDGDDPRAAYTFDITAGNAIMLPAGTIWRYGAFGQVSSADAWSTPAASPGPSSPFWVFLDQAEYDHGHSYPDTDPTGPFIYEGYWNNLWSSQDMLPTDQAGKLRTFNLQGTIANDNDAPAPFVMVGYTQAGWASDVHLVTFGFQMWRDIP